jgi:hypothetical protein
MRIIGSHDELLYLKIRCQQQAVCEYCVMEPFCRLNKEEDHAPVVLFSSEKIKSYVITDGGIYENKNNES